MYLDEVKLYQGDGVFAAVGAVDLRTEQLNLATTLEGLDISNAMLVFARAASLGSPQPARRIGPFCRLRLPAGAPGRDGRSTKTLITGGFDSPRLATDLTLDQLSFSGGAIDHIGGNVVVSLKDGAMSAVSVDLSATEGEAFAAVRGDIVPRGEVTLRGRCQQLRGQAARTVAPLRRRLRGEGDDQLRRLRHDR